MVGEYDSKDINKLNVAWSVLLSPAIFVDHHSGQNIVNLRGNKYYLTTFHLFLIIQP